MFDLRKTPAGSCIKRVGGTATITHVGKMQRVFMTHEGANLISVSQLAEAELTSAAITKSWWLVTRMKQPCSRQDLAKFLKVFT